MTDAAFNGTMAASGKADISPWLVAPTVSLAAFMEVLDVSIVNVALQHVGGSLSASADESTWVLTSYLVTNSIVLPIAAGSPVISGGNAAFSAASSGSASPRGCAGWRGRCSC